MLTKGLMLNLRYLASQFLPKTSIAQVSCRSISWKRSKKEEEASKAVSLEDEIDEEELKAREAEIERKRNKSELYPMDYNKQHGRPPYEEPQFSHHESLLYRRRLYGKYGSLSKVDPSILWPSKQELDYMKDYEEVAHPFTFRTLVEKAREKRALAEKKIQDEEAKILEKVSNVNYEIVQFHKRVALQKQKALETAKEKEKMIERVRKHFGYKIDVKDTKFQEVYAKFQKEESKKLKLEKKARRQEMLMGHISEGTQKKDSEEKEEEEEETEKKDT